jgi:hypothetical protein
VVPSIDDLRGLLTSGIERFDDSRGLFPALKEKKRSSQDEKIFGESPDAMIRSNEAFAALMLLRTRYADYEPSLTTGTIVRSETDEYLLCVLPACDSVRLKASRQFIFMPLAVVTDNSKRFNLLVPTKGGGPPVRLRGSLRVYDVRTIDFAPNEAERVKAVATDGEDAFESVSQGPYTWVAELKMLKAQSFGQKLAEQLSRPGIDDPEWLRSMERR